MEFEDGTPQDAVLCSQSQDSCDGALQQWKPCGTSAIQDNLICGKFSYWFGILYTQKWAEIDEIHCKYNWYL